LSAGARNKSQLLSADKSVFDLAFLNERTLPALFQILDLNESVIHDIKNLVDYRNDSLAHPKGYIEADIESKLQKYLEVLEKIQESMININDGVAERWLAEMEPGEAEVEYINLHLAEEYICPAEMQQGKLAKLDERLDGYI